jgi:hypothetical protein
LTYVCKYAICLEKGTPFKINDYLPRYVKHFVEIEIGASFLVDFQTTGCKKMSTVLHNEKVNENEEQTYFWTVDSRVAR